MPGAITAFGAQSALDDDGETITVTGMNPRGTKGPIALNARDSGTTSRFILPAVALTAGRGVVDGSQQLRRRPFSPLLDALRQTGVIVEDLGEPGFIPVAVTGPARGGTFELPDHMSSQFLSGLLLAGPLMSDGLDVSLTSPAVSLPYLTMITAVRRAFGAEVEGFHVRPGRYLASDFAVEPDASAASRTPATGGHSQRTPHPSALKRTTTDVTPSVTATTRPCATSRTSSSAACGGAWRTTRRGTRKPPGQAGSSSLNSPPLNP